MKSMARLALTLALAAAGATSAQAATPEGPGDSDVYVVNNYGAMVRVYAEDSDGRLHRLGRVAQGQLEAFDVPAEIAGEFQIKIYPAQPVWSLQLDDFGVKTNPIHLGVDGHVTVWVEPDLTKSVVEFARG